MLERKNEMNEMLQDLNRTFQEYGIKVNVNKTKIMVRGTTILVVNEKIKKKFNLSSILELG